MDWILKLITDTESVAHIVALYAIVIALGVALGKIKIGGIALGATFVLFVGILAGHLYQSFGIASPDGGLAVPHGVLDFVREFGLILFVYCIGLQVGPGFINSFKNGPGIKMNYITIGVVTLNVVVMLLLYFLLFASRNNVQDLPMMVGVMCGAVTNTPGLGAAQEALRSLDSEALRGINIASGYACAYPLGVVGIIGAMIVLRFIFGIKLDEEEKAIRQESQDNPSAKPHRMTVRVSNHAIVGKTVGQLRNFLGRTFVCTRLMRDESVSVVYENTLLLKDDYVNVICAEVDAEAIVALFGEEVQYDWHIENSAIVSKRILVTQASVNGRTLGQMHFRNLYGVNVTRLTRGGMELFADENIHIQIGDRLLVVGEAESVQRVQEVLGNSVKHLEHPNVGSIFLGVLIGIIFGSLPIAIPGMSAPLKLGLAGGPLIIAILISCYGYKLKIVSYTTSSANLLLREIGLILFLASVGIKAGATFWNTVSEGDGITYVWAGFLITIIPLLIMGFIARKFFKFNYFTLMGIIAGSTTDPPALGYATATANNDAPALGYSTVYPLTMFLRILVAQALILFLVS